MLWLQGLLLHLILLCVVVCPNSAIATIVIVAVDNISKMLLFHVMWL
jgi:hypothetical protein